jgi:hypothetical protein
MIFDLEEGTKLKEEGIAIAAGNDQSLLSRARDIAAQLAASGREITADDVQEVLFTQTGLQLGNSAGALFREPHWEFTGEWRRSRRKTNHAHCYRVWRLKY